ncbi:hypothetical protein PV10_08417 [Exophiala mesophila]|uniref:Glutathione S-transferase n=1 Tax=Exophiala mesophila TaxID=212818 RepID=A0A0D1Z1X8_EXOME|nr:uncharacterized protein PV10_08417 [Exophiala mesophila]KIV88772.1 hypothetical protein PV10_08417 [Exophiala mesophila]
MSTIKLFYAPGACSLASHILLRESGTSFEPLKIAFKSPELLALNPKLRVPVLIADGETITETPAIFTYIAQLAPEKHLLGKTNLEVVRTYEWLNWLSGTLHGQAFGGLLRPERYTDDQSVYPAVKEKGLSNVRDCFAKIEDRLTSVYAVGDSLTVVDVLLYVFYRWGFALGEDMRVRYPRYTKLALNVAERTSVKESIAAEGIDELIVPKL